MSQVEPKAYDRQPVPDLEDMVSLRAYQKLRDALQGFEAVLMEHFFDKTPEDRTAFVEDALDGLYEFRKGLNLLNCGNQCPKGKACVPCASAFDSHQGREMSGGLWFTDRHGGGALGPGGQIDNRRFIVLGPTIFLFISVSKSDELNSGSQLDQLFHSALRHELAYEAFRACQKLKDALQGSEAVVMKSLTQAKGLRCKSRFVSEFSVFLWFVILRD